MKKKHNYLIWAVLGTAVLMSLIVLLDGRAYSGFRKAHPEIPLAADLIAAAQEGVFPWSKPEEEAGDPEPEVVAVAVEPEVAATAVEPEVAVTAVEPAAAKGEYAKEVVLAAVRTGSSTMQMPGQETFVSAEGADGMASNSADSESSVTQSGMPDYRTVGVYYLADACFIGDSFTEGLQCYAQIPKADYYGFQGVNTYGIMKQKFKIPNGGEGTLEEALSQKQYGKIYILLGINELGSDTPEKFAQHYGELIGRIRARQPEALIFIQSIFHTTAKKSESSAFKNSVINAVNAELAKLADNKSVFYLDINPLFDDETGALRSDYSGDGVHIKANHYVEWRDFLLQHAIVKE